MSNVREEYRSEKNGEKKSKFMKAVLIGALTGAAVSLFDKNTRKTVIANGKDGWTYMKDLIQNPTNILEQVQETSSEFRSTVEKISNDVSFISKRVEEMKSIPTQVANVVMETKEAFASEVMPTTVDHQGSEKRNPLN
ncbi:YtxH domain-containing protein [Peribacillus sp. NPDC097295]|uniref:YtxH domain-containing protein n=1 Tax=Peribacillus sp. NPDC097295 TaxID=3364402 RepID=UPI00380DB887